MIDEKRGRRNLSIIAAAVLALIIGGVILTFVVSALVGLIILALGILLFGWLSNVILPNKK